MVFSEEEDPSCGNSRTINICGICGLNHVANKCEIVEIKYHVKDTPVLSKARLSLPKSLELQSMVGGVLSVTAKEYIDSGTKFGPFEAKKVFTPDLNINFSLKIFQTEELFQQLYLNNSNEDECNWMFFVQPAESKCDQNLVCYQEGAKIYFTSIRDILRGEHLKVWYSPYYAGKMDKPLLSEDKENYLREDVVNLDIDLEKPQQNDSDETVYKCKFCNLEEINSVIFAKHLKNHYTMQMYKSCEKCNKKFRTKQSLKKHMEVVHWVKESRNNNNDKDPCRNDNTQEGLGGPLLNNEYLNMENNLLDDEINENFSLENPSINLENDFNLNINENYNLSFNFLESNDSYFCDICLKSFSGLKCLIMHLAIHTEEYTCSKCKKAFSRKESLENHTICNPERFGTFKCNDCDKTFITRRNLTSHVRQRHNDYNVLCKSGCKKKFSTEEAANKHKCPLKLNLSCNICDKKFNTQKYLRRHMIIHSNSGTKNQHLCEICSSTFSSSKLLYQHQLSHRDNKLFTCNICDKSFKWRSSYTDHLESHQTDKVYLCPECNMSFKVKKYLISHMQIHNEDYPYKCQLCPQKFKQKTNLEIHIKRIHKKKCPTCGLVFTDIKSFNEHVETHLENCYKCPVCNHVVKLKKSMQKHIKQKHSHLNINLKDLDNKANEHVSNKEEKKCNNIESMEIQTDIDDALGNKNDNCGEFDKLLDLKEAELGVEDIYTNLDYIVNSYDENTNIPLNPQGRIPSTENMEDNILDFNRCLEIDFANSNNQEIY